MYPQMRRQKIEGHLARLTSRRRQRSFLWFLLFLSHLSLSSHLPFSLPFLPFPASAQTTEDRKAEADRLFQQGIQQFQTSQYGSALNSWEQALAIYRSIEDRNSEAGTLINLGNAYAFLSQYEKAITYYEQSLPIFTQVKNKDGEANALNNLGEAYHNLSQYGKAITYYEQALLIFIQVKDKNAEALVLNNLGLAYQALGNYGASVDLFQKQLDLAREIKNRGSEAIALGRIGSAYYSIKRYSEAIEYFQQALIIVQEQRDRLYEVSLLHELGNTYLKLGQNQQAIEVLQKKLALDREIGNRAGEMNSLFSLGWAYNFEGKYQQAIKFFQQTLAIAREIGARDKEISSLYALGWAYDDLGQRHKSVELYQQALKIAQEIQDRSRMADVLNGLGWVHNSLEKYQQAILFFQRQLEIAEEIRDLRQKANALNGLGWSFRALKQYQKSISFSRQALLIQQKIGDLREEAYSWGDLGKTFAALGQQQEAIEFYQQSLAIQNKIGNRWGKGVTLSDIADLFVKQNQPELAIIFYKQSVNVREAIRKDIQGLPKEQQESFTQTVAGTYRALADLLIEQGRIGEAQQVLERLKIQEINDFTKGTRVAAAISDVEFNATETQIKNKYSTLIAFGGRFYACEQSRCPQLGELRDQYRNLSKEFQDFVEETKKQLRDARLANVDNATDDFQKSADRVVTAHPNSILIYPLVLPDKTRLLWAGKGGVLSKTAVCPLGEKALYAKVAEFRKLLSRPGSDTQLKSVGKELYDCLVKPLEGELTANQIKHLIFVPDRATNYIPMAALYDGKQYLVERFAVSTVLSAGLTDTDSRLPVQSQQVPVLGLGLSEARGKFSALPNVEPELDGILKTGASDPAGIFPGLKFLNQAFDRNALEDNLRGHKILHIATHGEFKPSNPRDSYFLLGTGAPYAIPDIQTLRELRDVHLVVLSACETGLGGADGLGLEIAGMSSFFLGDRDRAKAVMASLWLVNDASTSLLMQQFYKNLATGKMTKAEALRQAQLSLLKGNLTAKDAPERSDIEVRVEPGSRATEGRSTFSHPYYWAPFILIGNSL